MTTLLPITFTSVINFHLVLSSLLVCIQFHIDLCFITIPMRIPSTEKTNNCLWNAANSVDIVSLSLAKYRVLRRLSQRRIDSLEGSLSRMQSSYKYICVDQNVSPQTWKELNHCLNMLANDVEMAQEHSLTRYIPDKLPPVTII